MRIALLTDGLFPYKIGGMQKHSLFLAAHLAKLGGEVDLYFIVDGNPAHLDPKPETLIEAEDHLKINYHALSRPEVPYFPGHYLRQSYLISKKLIAALQLNQPVDFIYAQGLTAWYPLQSKKKKLGLAPIGVNPHGLEMFQLAGSWKAAMKQRMMRWAMSDNLKKAPFVFSLGEGMSKLLLDIGINEKNILLSPNGIASGWMSREASAHHKPIQFLFVGRYEFRKGVEELHAVLRRLLDANQPFVFHLVGPIPKEKRIEHPSLKYWGAIQDEKQLQSIFSSCDVLACPSHSEGMPTVILEAMARGLAVLATDVGTVRSMVSPDNGWLIPPRSADALEAALMEAIHCPEEKLLKKKQYSLQKVRKNFLWEAVANTTLREIERAITHWKKEQPGFRN
ncbi:MAG: glycosyltransferase family 4 protein [Lewinellaceae bacterium]|nr:glycosyltransferase family 4 protein [Lewinellaceae bacterium]